jgi:hypothetical protein
MDEKYPHHDIVLKWLAGGVIQAYSGDGRWIDLPSSNDSACLPCFWKNGVYRVKPSPKTLTYRPALMRRTGAGVVDPSYYVRTHDDSTDIEIVKHVSPDVLKDFVMWLSDPVTITFEENI